MFMCSLHKPARFSLSLNQQVAVWVGPAREPTLEGHLNHRPARANLSGRARRPLVVCLTGPSTHPPPSSSTPLPAKFELGS